MFGHGMPFLNDEMKWVEVATAPIEIIYTEVVLQYFAFTVTWYAKKFTSACISVIKMHLVSYSCREKDKFTLPKKVMFKQNKGHLRGFPHPNPSKWRPFQSCFFSLQKHGSWLSNWGKNRSTSPSSWDTYKFSKGPKFVISKLPRKFFRKPYPACHI